MNLKQLSKEVGKQLGRSQADVYPVVRLIFMLVPQLILKGHIVRITGFMTMKLDVQKEVKKYIVGIGQHATIPRKFKLRMVLSKQFKKDIDEKKVY